MNKLFMAFAAILACAATPCFAQDSAGNRQHISGSNSAQTRKNAPTHASGAHSPSPLAATNTKSENAALLAIINGGEKKQKTGKPEFRQPTAPTVKQPPPPTPPRVPEKK